MTRIPARIDRRTLLLATSLAGASPLVARPREGTEGESRTGIVATRSVGRLEVMCLLDASGPFTLSPPGVAFPDADDADWSAARLIDPDAFGADGSWHLNFQCFVIAGPGDHITLVDTGVGPHGSPASSWAPVPGRLPQELAELGIQVDDVDVVVQTHLHSDHVGWAVYPNGEPVFPRARYVVQRTEVAALEAAGSALVPYVVEPLRATGQLQEIRGHARLAGGRGPGLGPGPEFGRGCRRGRGGHRIMAIPTPGHTPGHQSVLAEDGAEQIVMTGDVLVHAVQLANPELSYAYEDDSELARATRQALLARARQRRALLATAHLNRPFVAPR